MMFGTPPPSFRDQPLSIRPPAPLMFPRICQLAFKAIMVSGVSPTPLRTKLRVAGEDPAPPTSSVRTAVVPSAAPFVVFATAPPATVTVAVGTPKPDSPPLVV